VPCLTCRLPKEEEEEAAVLPPPVRFSTSRASGDTGIASLQAQRAAMDVAESPCSESAGAGVMEHSAADCSSTVRTWSDISSTLRWSWRIQG